MLKYIVILLDKTSVAYCHADNPFTERELMPFDILQKAIIWAMKENLMVQFVYPNYELPPNYIELIDTVDHIDIRPDNKASSEIRSDGIASASLYSPSRSPL